MIQWVDELVRLDPEALAWAWARRTGDGLGLASANRADLEDAARARAPDGGAGRLFRRRMARTLAAQLLGLAPDEVGMERGADGRPALAAAHGLHLSGSGCAPWSLMVVARPPVGADLERPARAERDLRALWPDLDPDVSIERWVAREAIAKAAGVWPDQPEPPGWRTDLRRAHDWVACVALPDVGGLNGPARRP